MGTPENSTDPKPWLTRLLQCPHCFKHFYPKYRRPGRIDPNLPYPMTCSLECRSAHHSMMCSEKGALRRLGYHRHAARLRMKRQKEQLKNEKRFLRSHAIVIRLATRHCLWCNAPMLRRFRAPTQSRYHPGLTCSPTCWVQHRRRVESLKMRKKVAKRVLRPGQRQSEEASKMPTFTALEIFQRDNWTCYICGVRMNPADRGKIKARAPHLDHIRSLSEGGTHTVENVATACRECNLKKGTESLDYIPPPLPGA